VNIKWLKHAFAVDAAEVAEPDEGQQMLVDQLCGEIVRRRLTSPALLLLEMSRPVNYVSAQFLHFVQPFVSILMDTGSYEQLTLFLEKRGSVEYLCRRLEALERNVKD
jgi:hypothetical protein